LAATVRAGDPPGGISGRVYKGPNANGDGVPNVEVKIGFEGKTDSRRTGPDGGYQFGELLPGRYTVSVVVPNGFRLSSDGTISVVVQPRKITGGVSFGIVAKPEPTPKPATPERRAQTPTPTPAPATATRAPSPELRDDRQNDQALARPASVPNLANLFVPTPSASSPPVAEATAEATPTAAPAVAAGATPGPTPTRPGPTTASPDDILAGLGVHWRPTNGASAVVAPTQPPTATAEPERRSAEDGVAASAPRRLVTSFETLRRAAGQTAASQVRTWANDSSFWLGVPFKTQIDGSEFSSVNCGPASLAMVLAGFGLGVDPSGIRDYINHLLDQYDAEEGTSLDMLARVAREAGLNTFGLYGRSGYRPWSVDEIREHVKAGHPVITLVKYRSLPGHGTSLSDFDHYIVISGLAGDDLIYNDSAFATDYGFNLLISPEDLEQAWSYSSIPRHAVAIGLSDDLRPLPNVPPRLTAASLAIGPEAARDAEAPLGMVPGPATLWLRDRMLAEVGARPSTPNETVAASPDQSAAPVAPVQAAPIADAPPGVADALDRQEASEHSSAARPGDENAVESAPPPEQPVSSAPPAPTDPGPPAAAYLAPLVVVALVLRRHLGGRSSRP
jgi:hypothetical protein